MDLYKDLLVFLGELKEYKKILNELFPNPPISSAPIRDSNPFAAFEGKKYEEKLAKQRKLDNKREYLLRNSSILIPRITELTGKELVTIHEFGKPRSVNMWDMGLRAEFDYRTAEALNSCIDNTIIAIGKLEAEGKSWDVIDNKQRSTKTELSVDNSEKSAYQKSWQWIESNKILSIIGAIAAIATIVGVVLALIR